MHRDEVAENTKRQKKQYAKKTLDVICHDDALLKKCYLFPLLYRKEVTVQKTFGSGKISGPVKK